MDIGPTINIQKNPKIKALIATGLTICHKEKPPMRIMVISLRDDNIENVTIADIKTKDGTMSFRKAGICKNAIFIATKKEASDDLILSRESSRLIKNINSAKTLMICKKRHKKSLAI